MPMSHFARHRTAGSTSSPRRCVKTASVTRFVRPCRCFEEDDRRPHCIGTRWTPVSGPLLRRQSLLWMASISSRSEHRSPVPAKSAHERDVATVRGARFSLPKGSRFHVEHVPGRQEPKLWSADLVAGAVRASRQGDATFRRELDHCLYESELDTRTRRTPDMRKARVPVCPGCTWPCDSPGTRGAALSTHGTRPHPRCNTSALTRRGDPDQSGPRVVRVVDHAGALTIRPQAGVGECRTGRVSTPLLPR